MPCTCGAIISNATYPSVTEGMLLGETIEDTVCAEMVEKVVAYFQTLESGTPTQWSRMQNGAAAPGWAAHRDVISRIVSDAIFRHGKSVAECEHCGRVWIQKEPFSSSYLAYSPDLGNFHSICTALNPD